MNNKLKCIMLIDDNFHDNFFHQLAINELDIADKIQIANDGYEALDMLGMKNPCIPELIFLDINMPRITGWEFLEEYKKLPISSKTKIIIIMLTTSGNPSDIQKAENCPEVRGYETKPLTVHSLREIIHEYFPELEPLPAVI